MKRTMDPVVSQNKRARIPRMVGIRFTRIEEQLERLDELYYALYNSMYMEEIENVINILDEMSYYDVFQDEGVRASILQQAEECEFRHIEQLRGNLEQYAVVVPREERLSQLERVFESGKIHTPLMIQVEQPVQQVEPPVVEQVEAPVPQVEQNVVAQVEQTVVAQVEAPVPQAEAPVPQVEQPVVPQVEQAPAMFLQNASTQELPDLIKFCGLHRSKWVYKKKLLATVKKYICQYEEQIYRHLTKKIRGPNLEEAKNGNVKSLLGFLRRYIRSKSRALVSERYKQGRINGKYVSYYKYKLLSK